MDAPLAKLEFIASLVLFATLGLMLRLIDLPSEVVALCRGVISAAFLGLYYLLRGKRPDRASIRRNRKWLLLSGLFLGLNWTLLFAAYVTTTVAVASLCNYMAPMFLIFLSPILFGERLSGRKLLCVAAAFAGIVLVSGVITGGGAGVNLPGVLLGLGAALGFTGIVVCNKHLAGMDALDKTLVQLSLSVIVVLPNVLWRNRGVPLQPDLQTVLLTIVVGVVQTGVAYILYFGSMAKLRVQTVAILGYVEPVVAVLTSAWILREHMGADGWLGAALILSAAVCAELVDQKEKQTAVR